MPSVGKRKFGQGVLSKKVLVLNKAYMAVNVITVRRAVELWFNEKVQIIHEYEDLTLRSGYNPTTGLQFTMAAPCVVMMPESRLGKTKMVDSVPFSRLNIFHRDGGHCVYCFKALTPNTFTIDHVVPRAKGGLTDWYNCRTSCSPCNNKKGDKTVEELGWSSPPKSGPPLLTAKVPKNVINLIAGKIQHESWRPYIYWEYKKLDDI